MRRRDAPAPLASGRRGLLPTLLLLAATASVVRGFLLQPQPQPPQQRRLLQHQQQHQQQRGHTQGVTPSRWGQQQPRQAGRMWASVGANDPAAASMAAAAAAQQAASAAEAEADPSLMRGYGYYGAAEGRRRVLEDGLVLAEGPAPGSEEGEGRRLLRLLLPDGATEVGTASFVEARGKGLCLTGVEVAAAQRGKGYGRRLVVGALERFLNKGGRIAQVTAAVPQGSEAEAAGTCVRWRGRWLLLWIEY